jgi:hypothetical protein
LGYEPLFPLCEPARDRCFLDLSPIIAPHACSRSLHRAPISLIARCFGLSIRPLSVAPLLRPFPRLSLSRLPLSSPSLRLSPSLHDSPLCHSPPNPSHRTQRVAAPSFPGCGRRCFAMQPIVSAGDSSTVTITGKVRRLAPWRRECWMRREHGRCLQFFRCDSTCLGFVKEKGASSFSLLGFSLAKARGRGARGSALHSTRSYTWASRTSASLLAGQCLPCQDGTYILGGGGKECTPCPSGSGFCPGQNIVIPEPGHWQAQRCRSG